MADHKTVRLVFTGVAVLSPAYGADAERPGPIWVLMPNSSRARWSLETKLDDNTPIRRTQIDAHFVFGIFDHDHLELADDTRNADYDYPDEKDPRKAVCFFRREHLELYPEPREEKVTYDTSDASGTATSASTGVGWIADWEKFAPGGKAHFRRTAPNVLRDPGEYVRLFIPGGHVSSRFVFEPPPQAKFLYGTGAKARTFAQEIVVTVTYPREREFIEIRSTPFEFPGSTPTKLRLTFADSNEIEVKFGNGTVASLDNLLSGSFAGHDHAGPVDYEFQLLYDVVTCEVDEKDRLPVPFITSREISRVPCIASMLDDEEVESAVAATRGAARQTTRAGSRRSAVNRPTSRASKKV